MDCIQILQMSQYCLLKQKKACITHCNQLSLSSCSCSLFSSGVVCPTSSLFHFEALRPVILSKTLLLGFACCFLMIKFRSRTFGRKPAELISFSQCLISGATLSVAQLRVMLTACQHLVRVLSARFPHHLP